MAEGGEVWEARETLMNVVTAVRRGAAAPGGSGVAAPASAGPGMGVQPLTPRDVQEGSSNPMSICTDLLFFFLAGQVVFLWAAHSPAAVENAREESQKQLTDSHLHKLQ